MARNSYTDKKYSNDPFDDGISPIIDPASAYQADPEINFDNVKQPKGKMTQQDNIVEAEQAPQEKTVEKTILERLRQARPHGDKPSSPEDPAEHQVAPGPCPYCAEAEKTRLLALADMENARKRLAREKEDFVKFAGESILADIIPALDNLDLALAYAPDGKDCKNFVIGVDMTRKLLLDALAKHGLEQVGELGEVFDPAKHEAVETQEHPDYESGHVCGLINKGYRLKDRLIRPARVKVCQKS